MTETGITFPRRWVIAGACCLLWVGGCRTEPDRWEDVEVDVLERKRAALAGYLDEPETLGGLSNDGMLVVLRQELVRHAVQVLLPAHQTWGPLGVRFDSAHIDLAQGLAVLEVRGEVSLDEPNPMSADLTLLGVVEVSGVDRERGRLTTGVSVLGTHVHGVGESPVPGPLLRAVDDVGDAIARDLGERLRELEVPVSLAPLQLPPVREDEVTIDAVTLPFDVSVRTVHVFADRLWISLAVGIDTTGVVAPQPGEQRP